MLGNKTRVVTRNNYVKPVTRVVLIAPWGMLATSETLPEEQRDDFVVGARESGFDEDDL